MGYTKPTAIQCKAIPVVLQGRDVMGGAQTGTGKTASFGLPVLQKLLPLAHIQHPVGFVQNNDAALIEIGISLLKVV